MSKPKLTYFDFPGGRGEDSRIALFIAGVDFEDNRIKFPSWKELKSQTPYGGLPTLEVEGKPTLAQSNAILGYIGRAYDLHPSDAWEAARHDGILAAAEELRTQFGPTMSIKDEDEKKQKRQELASGYAQTWAANIEAQIGDGPFVGGDTIGVVDLKLFVVLGWLKTGKLDHVPTDVFKDFPKLNRLYEAVKGHEKVVAWYAR